MLPLDELVDAPELERPDELWLLAGVDVDELEAPVGVDIDTPPPEELPPDEAVDTPEAEPLCESELLAVVDPVEPVADEPELHATLRIENNSPATTRDRKCMACTSEPWKFT